MADQGPPRAFDTEIAAGRLVVRIRREFDFGNLHRDWAHNVVVSHPGPYTRVVLDMSLCGLVSSTFFAGLIQLHQHYVAKMGLPPLLLHRPDPRVLRNLEILHFDELFEVESA